MPNSVAIIGIGFTPAQPTTAHCSFKEMMFETAQKAYLDAGVEPTRSILSSFPQATAPSDVDVSPYLFYPWREASERVRRDSGNGLDLRETSDCNSDSRKRGS